MIDKLAEAQRYKGNQTQVRQFAIGQAQSILMAAGVVDPEWQGIDVPVVSKRLYLETREAWEQAGYNFVVPIRPVSIADMLKEDSRCSNPRFGFVVESPLMRGFTPQKMEVVVNRGALIIKDSWGLSVDARKNKLQEEADKVRAKAPEDIRHLIVMRIVDPSTLVQIEAASIHKDGIEFGRNFFLGTDIRTSFRVGINGNSGEGYVACVHRDYDIMKDGRLTIGSTESDKGHCFVAAIGILPRLSTK